MHDDRDLRLSHDRSLRRTERKKYTLGDGKLDCIELNYCGIFDNFPLDGGFFQIKHLFRGAWGAG